MMEEESMSHLSENLERLEAEITAVCRAAGRSRASVELMAVSKTYPAETMQQAVRLGLHLFGENRVQEFATKALRAAEFRRICGEDRARVHVIGHLQSNKAAKAVEIFDGVDSLDSLKLAERLNDAAAKLTKRLPVLLEVKLSTEETKAGLDPNSADAAQLLERLPDLAHLDVQGLMTIAPFDVSEDQTRACFRQLRTLRDQWAQQHQRLNLGVLSMGMSGDFSLAIQEGATRIRVGTALFGQRNYAERP
jgi:hypothetical protein